MSKEKINSQSEKHKLSRKEKKQIDGLIRQAKGDGKPHTAQDSIPFERMYKDGICRLAGNRYSKCIAFEDMNYQLAQPDDKTAVFEALCDMYNAFDASIGVQLSLISRYANKEDFKQSITISPQGDEFDSIRAEYTEMLQTQLERGNNGLIKTKFLTFTTHAENIKTARARLNRIETDTLNHFKVIGAAARTLDGKQRLEVLHGIFHPDGDRFNFSWDWLPASGLSVKDFIAPSSFRFGDGRMFRMGGKYGAASFLQIVAPELSDRMLADFMEAENGIIVNGTDWKNDADKHWHECSCGAKADEADHVYDDGQDTTCNVCDYVRTVAPTTYTLTVDLKGGSGSTTGGEYTEGAVIHINAGTRSDYRFSGWTSSNGGSFADASSASTTFTMPAADTTVTANWQYNGGTGSTTDYYRLTFDTNGGSEIASIRRAEYTTIDLADYIPTREGYEFTGWYADEDLTDKVTSIRLTRNTTIYAGWEENKENPSTGGNPFTDVKESDWFYDDVMFVYKNGLMTGTSATTFSPYSNTTRAQIATIFYRLDGSPEVTGKNSFADVEYSPATTWYYDAVTWVQQSGVMGGYGNDLFGPNDPVTREQLASIFYRYAQYKGYDVSTTGSLDSFTDKDSVSAWAQEAMKWAVGNGIINGRENNLLDPQGTATRAEIAAMLHRFIEKYGPVIAGVTDKANPTSSQLNVPKTGDSTTEAVGWISLMAASAAGAAYATHKLRRRKKDGLKPPTPTPA